MLKPKDALIINAVSGIWFSVSIAMRQLDELVWAHLKPKGDKELARLKAAALKGSDALKEALSEYSWLKDEIDYVPSPWLVAARGYDDCDGSTWLCASIMKGRLFCIMEVRDGKPENYAKWHFFFQSANGDIWSNYRLEGNKTPEKFAKLYNHKATHLVEIAKELKVLNIKEL